MVATKPKKDQVAAEPHGLAWWIIGGAVGTTLAVTLAIAALGVSGALSRSEGASEARTTPAPAAGAPALTLVATEFAYDPPTAVGAETLEITLLNEGLILHNLEIEGVDGFVLEVEAGESAAGEISLPAGTYFYFCSIPGHREVGMEGRLTIAR